MMQVGPWSRAAKLTDDGQVGPWSQKDNLTDDAGGTVVPCS
jgi:hypothetical protein